MQSKLTAYLIFNKFRYNVIFQCRDFPKVSGNNKLTKEQFVMNINSSTTEKSTTYIFHHFLHLQNQAPRRPFHKVTANQNGYILVFHTVYVSTNPNSPTPTEMKDALLYRPITFSVENHSFCKADALFCSKCLPALKAKINCMLNSFIPSNVGRVA